MCCYSHGARCRKERTQRTPSRLPLAQQIEELTWEEHTGCAAQEPAKVKTTVADTSRAKLVVKNTIAFIDVERGTMRRPCRASRACRSQAGLLPEPIDTLRGEWVLVLLFAEAAQCRRPAVSTARLPAMLVPGSEQEGLMAERVSRSIVVANVSPMDLSPKPQPSVTARLHEEYSVASSATADLRRVISIYRRRSQSRRDRERLSPGVGQCVTAVQNRQYQRRSAMDRWFPWNGSR